MRRSPSIASAQPDDVDIYLVLDDFGGRLGRATRDRRRTHRSGDCHCRPARGPVFQSHSGHCIHSGCYDRQAVAAAPAPRLAFQGQDSISELEEFLDRHIDNRPVQLPLPLRGAAGRPK
jgi:hypothetical protein